MLETMENMTLCGVYYYNDIYEDIYADEYGILAFESSLDGGCYEISEIVVNNPMPISTSAIIRCMESDEYGKCMGVVYTLDGTVVVLLDDQHAVTRSVVDLKKNIGEVFYYSTDADYEIEGED